MTWLQATISPLTLISAVVARIARLPLTTESYRVYVNLQRFRRPHTASCVAYNRSCLGLFQLLNSRYPGSVAIGLVHHLNCV